MCTIAHVCKQFNLNKGLHNRIKWVMKAMETIYKANSQNSKGPNQTKNVSDDGLHLLLCQMMTNPLELLKKRQLHVFYLKQNSKLTFFVILPLWSASISLKAFSFFDSCPENSCQESFPFWSLSWLSNSTSTSSLIKPTDQSIEQQNDQSINLSRRSSLIFLYANSYPARHTPI